MPINTSTTNLENADFSQRDDKKALRGADLSYHRCKNAKFSGLDLTGVNLIGCDLTGAQFDGAILDGAKIYGIQTNIGSDVQPSWRNWSREEVEKLIAPAKSAKEVVLEPPPAPEPGVLPEVVAIQQQMAALQEQMQKVLAGQQQEPAQKGKPK